MQVYKFFNRLGDVDFDPIILLNQNELRNDDLKMKNTTFKTSLRQHIVFQEGFPNSGTSSHHMEWERPAFHHSSQGWTGYDSTNLELFGLVCSAANSSNGL